MNEIEDGRERLLSADTDKIKADLAKRLREADWHYSFSDDATARRRGAAEVNALYRDVDDLVLRDRGAATEIWEANAPKDQRRPESLDKDSVAIAHVSPSVDVPIAQRGREKSDEAPQKTPSRDQDPSQAPIIQDDLLLVALHKRYLVADDKYHKRDAAGTIAFEDHGRRLTTKFDDAEIAASMVEVARIKGWESLKLKGSEAFKREVWLKAKIHCLDVQGFNPKTVDLARLAERQGQRERPAIGSLNTVERSERTRSVAEPAQRLSKDEPEPKLTDGQVVALDAMKALMLARGDSPKAIDMADAVARERFRSSRVYVGKIIEQGVSPFENNPSNQPSAYLKLQTAKGIEMIWGTDLPRAVEISNAGIGDEITLTSPGRKPVTVKIKDRDASGQITGERDITTNRNVWEVNKLESLREEARDRLLRMANQQTAAVRTFDSSAPRAQRDRASNKLAIRAEKDRSRG